MKVSQIWKFVSNFLNISNMALFGHVYVHIRVGFQSHLSLDWSCTGPPAGAVAL